MDKEFSIQLLAMKMFNFNKNQTNVQKYFVIIFQIFNLFINFYCLFGHGLFVALNYSNVFKVSECISPISLILLTLVKFYVICFHYYKFFDVIADIKCLNEKCEYKNFIFK